MPDLGSDYKTGQIFGTGACDSPVSMYGDTFWGVNNAYISNADIFGFPNGYYNIEGIFNDVYNSWHSMLEFECIGYNPRRDLQGEVFGLDFYGDFVFDALDPYTYFSIDGVSYDLYEFYDPVVR